LFSCTRPVVDGTRRSSRPAETFVVDITPEIGVVLRIRDGNSLAGMVVSADAVRESQFFCVNVESVDIVEHAFGVVHDATGSWAVPVSRRQRRHAPPEASDQVVKLGKFGCAGQATSLGEGCQ
jgi:hypothetical protein